MGSLERWMRRQKQASAIGKARRVIKKRMMIQVLTERAKKIVAAKETRDAAPSKDS
jgi:hypothetical protein